MQPTVVDVVVADDDADIRDLVELKLTQSGYTVRASANGVEALEEIRRDPPDLAVLDVMMPGLSGIDVLREIRADDALRNVRVVLLTARSRDTDVDMGFSTGADDYLIKPFSPRELVHRIAALVARPR
ncbi:MULTISPECIES: response regulator transcription factor [unclassified Knoellia]|uniref:response regulator transcription factor n=1 Tax=Knoellia altitudinis TaxID=3404795 RepID=UPI00361AA7FF